LAALVDGALEGRNNGTLAVPPTEVLNRIRAIANTEREEEEKNDPILTAIRHAGTSTQTQTAPPEDSDSVWDALIDCYDLTEKPSQREEALRVAAVWELLRADAFQKMYRAAASPVRSARCRDLDRLAERVDAALKNNEPWKSPPPDFQPVLQGLRGCAEDSEQLNSNRELPEALRARRLMFGWEVMLYNSLVAGYNAVGAVKKAPHEVAGEEWRKALADPSSLVTVRADERLPDGELARAAAHNRALCDQVITVAGLTPQGLALYVPPAGQEFMKKNFKNYPRMCLVENADYSVPGVPSYLLVYTYSEGAFAGFQPVTQARTTPVFGSGTVTNAYGANWNFTYSGTLTEIDTVEAPYVIQSHSLFLHAYDQNGHVVSQHSITTSSQTGGDASYAAGYNAGALISLLWNNPAHLIKSVLKDVQKDSMKYGKK